MDLKTMKFAGELFRIAAERAGNRCSDDTDKEFLDSFGFTDDEKIALAGEFHEWNGVDPDDLGMADFKGADRYGKIKEFYYIHESAWMAFFAAKLTAGKVFLEFPLRVYPHFGLPASRELVSNPLELGAAIERGIAASPTGKVSLGNV